MEVNMVEINSELSTQWSQTSSEIEKLSDRFSRIKLQNKKNCYGRSLEARSNGREEYKMIQKVPNLSTHTLPRPTKETRPPKTLRSTNDTPYRQPKVMWTTEQIQKQPNNRIPRYTHNQEHLGYQKIQKIAQVKKFPDLDISRSKSQKSKNRPSNFYQHPNYNHNNEQQTSTDKIKNKNKNIKNKIFDGRYNTSKQHQKIKENLQTYGRMVAEDPSTQKKEERMKTVNMGPSYTHFRPHTTSVPKKFPKRDKNRVAHGDSIAHDVSRENFLKKAKLGNFEKFTKLNKYEGPLHPSSLPNYPQSNIPIIPPNNFNSMDKNEEGSKKRRTEERDDEGGLHK